MKHVNGRSWAAVIFGHRTWMAMTTTGWSKNRVYYFRLKGILVKGEAVNYRYRPVLGSFFFVARSEENGSGPD